MDEIDQAQHQELLARDVAMAQHRARRGAPEPCVRDGVRVCLGCFEPIEPRRLRALPDAVRCTQCQDDFERYQWTGR